MTAGSLYVGRSGWAYDHWQGPFYPEDFYPEDRSKNAQALQGMVA